MNGLPNAWTDLSIGASRQQIDNILNRLQSEPITVWKDGRRVAVLLSPEKYQQLAKPEILRPHTLMWGDGKGSDIVRWWCSGCDWELDNTWGEDDARLQYDGAHQ